MNRFITSHHIASHHIASHRITSHRIAHHHLLFCHDPIPSTISLSILVTIEMFNALNALSENQSLLVVPPWANVWVLMACALSFTLHFVILYVPFLAGVFHVAPIDVAEWGAVLWLSAPVIAIDECLKLISRKFAARGDGPKRD